MHVCQPDSISLVQRSLVREKPSDVNNLESEINVSINKKLTKKDPYTSKNIYENIRTDLQNLLDGRKDYCLHCFWI